MLPLTHPPAFFLRDREIGSAENVLRRQQTHALDSEIQETKPGFPFNYLYSTSLPWKVKLVIVFALQSINPSESKTGLSVNQTFFLFLW